MKLFLLTNNLGGYFALGHPEYSNFLGLFHFIPEKWTLYKTIENIDYEKSKNTIKREKLKINQNYNYVERICDNVNEKFQFYGNCLTYELQNYNGFVNIDLDFRQIYDFDDKNRIYNIYNKDNTIIIEYKKDTKILKIYGAKDYEPINKWQKKEYIYDKNRNSRFEFYIYKALKIKVEGSIKLKFVLYNKCEDKNELASYYSQRQFGEDYFSRDFQARNHSIGKNEDKIIEKAANALLSLVVNIPKIGVGIFAGVPWFFQLWTRDELISLIALILIKKYDWAKSIIKRYINNILPDGRLPTILFKTNTSTCADGIGWLFKRIYDLLKTLEKEGIIFEYFKLNELQEIKEILENIICNIKGLIFNNDKETWMDTIQRKGFRIEIQSLYLNMFYVLKYLCKLTKTEFTQKYNAMWNALHKQVREKLFINKMLYDGYCEGLDTTIRPNIFISYYVYPQLLTRKEWEYVFKTALKYLWLEWGGLSTIQKEHPLFCSKYTGENDKSYHNGDSWFFINNMAAICMRRLNELYFKNYIDKIIKASISELLEYGFIGHHAELSSAEKLEPGGCLSQAWSAAMLFELLYENNRNR